MAALAIAPAAASAAPSPVVDNDFAGGTAGANTWVVEPGRLQLRPAVSANFDGTALPADWPATAWDMPPTGTATVANGAVTVNGARVNTAAPPSATSGVLEFRATFANAVNQHVGFGDTFNDPPWAMFSTGNGSSLPAGLYARTGDTSTTLPATIVPTEPHVYRIEWTAAEVRYFVDGNSVATHAVAVAGPMRPVISDFDPAAPAVTVDWIAMSPNPTSGNFESRMLEADDARAVWGTLTATPAAGVTFETRTGNSAAAMSDYQPVGAGGAVQSPPGKFIQYRATLTTADVNTTPSLDSVSITYAIDATAPTASIGSADVSGSTAKVTFSSPDADIAGFQCSLDGGAFAACTSPKEFAGLAAGSHTISVRAVDKAGNVGQAVSKTVTVASSGGGGGGNNGPGGAPDTVAPKVAIGSSTLRASASGKFKLRLTCPDDEVSCTVDVKLKLKGKVIASKTVMLPGGDTAKVTLRLTSKARKKLAARGRLKAKAVITGTDAAGNRDRSKYSVTIRPR